MSTHESESVMEPVRTVSTRRRVAAALAVPVIAAGPASLPMRALVGAAERRRGPGAEDLGLPAYNSVINILDNGPANPYGSAFEVKDLKGFITDVNLVLKGFRHDRPSDVAIMLSHGGRAAVVMRNVGGTSAVRGANILLNDEASGTIPIAGPIEGGRAYKPTDNGGPVFGGGAPDPSSQSPQLLTFDGLTPNGEWVLWVRDNAATIAGSLTGWQLQIVTNDPSGSFIVIDNYRARGGRKLDVRKDQGLLAIDKSDPQGSYQVQLVQDAKGKLNLRPDGSFTYKPTGNRRKDSFTYVITSEFGTSIEGNGKVNIKIDRR